MFEYLYQGCLLVLIFSALPLGVSAALGLVISVLQAVTQIQEQTLVYLAKLVVIIVVVYLGGEWAGLELIRYLKEGIEIMGRLHG